MLCDIVEKEKGSVIIFLNTKRGVDRLANELDKKFNVVAIHGDKKQSQRQKVINWFTAGRTQILIATDVASRGHDFPNVECVINYEIPKNIDDYIHRIGRTGVGKKGKLISFVEEMDRGIFRKLYKFLRRQKQDVPNWLERENIRGKNYEGKRRENNRNNIHSSWEKKENVGWGIQKNESWEIQKKDDSLGVQKKDDENDSDSSFININKTSKSK